MKTTQNSLRSLFQPAPRGNTATALAKGAAITVVAPQSPRPAEMLSGVTIDNGDVDLTSLDLALHELLISRAYETDRSMSVESYEIPIDECLRFLGRDARRDTLNRSIAKMKRVELSFTGETGRTYTGVPMLTAWEATLNSETSLGFQFAEPLRKLMRVMPSYGYIELAALGRGAMRSKYSHLLYKHLVLEVAKHPWEAGNDNRFEITFTPDELAAVVCFRPINGTVPFGKLQERVIAKVVDDFAGVRKFDLRITYDGLPAPKKGKTVKEIEFGIRVHPNSHHTVRANTQHLQSIGHRVGAPDEPRFRVNSVFWLRVPRKFANLGIDHFLAHAAWLVALTEALDEKPLTPEFSRRRYRGQNLLSAIDVDGVEAAAWGFFAEESELGRDLIGSDLAVRGRKSAEKARIKRLEKRKKNTTKAPTAGPDAAIAAVSNRYVSFETCTHIDLEIDQAANNSDLDDVIYQHLRTVIWSGSRRISLRAYFYVPGTSVRSHYHFWAAPADEDELAMELRKIDRWLIDTPTYRIETGGE
ncbi:hypothetical protein GAO09_08555 [Rhizobiales bacterium RZME27]|uniref:RepB family plasmid replication initiator protein n=1 Tax=Endobacterium cereale TaxID=2663029 RepID=A0A6A8A4F6_9HYPH|nr:replication initiation protein [Endobacterium cereale]MQY46105.1 hypothetical protein [Endobacterium cereale]